MIGVVAVAAVILGGELGKPVGRLTVGCAQRGPIGNGRGFLTRRVGHLAALQRGRARVVGIVLGRAAEPCSVGCCCAGASAQASGTLSSSTWNRRWQSTRRLFPIHVDRRQEAGVVLRPFNGKLVVDVELGIFDFFAILEKLGLGIAREISRRSSSRARRMDLLSICLSFPWKLGRGCPLVLLLGCALPRAPRQRDTGGVCRRPDSRHGG